MPSHAHRAVADRGLPPDRPLPDPEIARFPAGAAHLRTAEYAAQVLDKDDPAWSEAMTEIRAVYESARESLTHE